MAAASICRNFCHVFDIDRADRYVPPPAKALLTTVDHAYMAAAKKTAAEPPALCPSRRTNVGGLVRRRKHERGEDATNAWRMPASQPGKRQGHRYRRILGC